MTRRNPNLDGVVVHHEKAVLDEGVGPARSMRGCLLGTPARTHTRTPTHAPAHAREHESTHAHSTHATHDTRTPARTFTHTHHARTHTRRTHAHTRTHTQYITQTEERTHTMRAHAHTPGHDTVRRVVPGDALDVVHDGAAPLAVARVVVAGAPVHVDVVPIAILLRNHRSSLPAGNDYFAIHASPPAPPRATPYFACF